MATFATPQQLVIVLDFGAQYGQLIARRVRDLGVYSEIVPCDITADEVRELAPSAIILSGGPASVYAEDAPSVDAAIFELGIPVLGFCYGQQAMAVALGGAVGHTDKGEYGPAKITRAGSDSRLLADTPHEQTVWMSHRDAVTEVPDGFVITSHTDICPVASMEDAERGLYATQFHPEVRHTPHGNQMLANFLFDICGLEKSWTMDSIIEDSIAAIREQVGDSRVILGLSGGVDSSVVAALVSKAIGDQVTCVFVNHGLLRKDEPEQVEEVFTKQFDVDFVHVHAEDRYAELLAGVTDPEQKRRIIGEQFWKEFFAVAEELAEDGRPVRFLAQGTDLSRHHRERRAQDRRQGLDHQEPPQSDSVSRRGELRAHRAARPLLQGRGARTGHGARAARPHRAAPAVSGAGPGDPHHRRRDARETRDAQGG